MSYENYLEFECVAINKVLLEHSHSRLHIV